jgi:hypothetical protein
MRNRPLRRCGVVSAGGPRRNGTFHSQCLFLSTDIRQNTFETFHMRPLAACGSSQHGVRLARWVARSELRRLPRAICICTVDWPTERTWKRKVPAQATDECANVWRSSFL